MLFWLLGAMALFVLALSVRLRIRVRPSPQGRPGESPQEAHLLLLGTYRLYTWLVWANLGVTVLGILGGDQIRGSLGFLIPAVAVNLALLKVAHALYWRLGYDGASRLIFTVAHLSGLCAVTEYFMAISSDIAAYIEKHEQGQGFSL